MIPSTPRQYGFDALCEALRNEHIPASAIASTSDVAKKLHEILSPDAQAIVVEDQYTDGDYLEDFAAYYVRCFGHYLKSCKRLHFFSLPPDDSDIQGLAQGDPPKSVDRIQFAYLGFVVARPLPRAVVGRTVLKPPPSLAGGALLCTHPYKANLFGVELTVPSVAYQEQDRVVAACATVALWSCFHVTQPLHGSQSPSPVAITRAATTTSYDARPFPSRGLTTMQICTAIREAGLEPEVQIARPELPLASMIYSYVASGQPVLLEVNLQGEDSLHAVAVVGCELSKDAILDHESTTPDEPRLVGRRIKRFIVHDDQVGPFAKLDCVGDRTLTIAGKDVVFPLAFVSEWKREGVFRTMYPRLAVVPIYHKIRVRFSDIFNAVHKLSKALFAKRISDPMEWDIRLVRSNRYKQDLRLSMIAPEVKAPILLHRYPRFLWLATLTTEKGPLCHLVFDATDMGHSNPLHSVVWLGPKDVREAIGDVLNRAGSFDELVLELGSTPISLLRDSCSLPGVHFRKD